MISSGAAVAVPFFYLGKLMGSNLFILKCLNRVDKPTMTEKWYIRIVDEFIVQWEEQLKVYPKAINLGSILLRGGHYDFCDCGTHEQQFKSFEFKKLMN